MRRAMLMLVAAAVAFTLVGGTALAKPERVTRGDGQARIAARPAASEVAAPPTKGLTAAPPVKDGKVLPERAGRQGAAAAGEPKWFNGTSSNTHYRHIITGTIFMLTSQSVAFWGTEDLSYPKVGDIYYGRAMIANIGTISTPAVPNVQLPGDTYFAMDPQNPDARVLCFFDDFNTGQSTELTGANCPQAPSQGLYGAQFAPQGGYWTLRPGQAIRVIFPLLSTDELKGIAATPADCLIGATWAAASIEIWDAPEVGDRCPLPKDHGVWQGLFVAFNPPTVGYPTPSATNVTETGARTAAHLFSHFDPGTAFVDFGTTTGYGEVSSVAIPNTHDSFTVTTDWNDLSAATTYHWRLRFVDQKGRTFTGADQTFRTAAPPPDTTAPAVTRVVPAENATNVKAGANVSVQFSEAMAAGTVNADTIQLFKKGSRTAVPAVVSLDATGRKVVLNPSANLEPGATYKVVVSNRVKDLAGNPLARAKAWFFTVKG